MHLELLEQVPELIPMNKKVVFLGDGEFDGVKLLAALDKYHWQYVCKPSQKYDCLWKSRGSNALLKIYLFPQVNAFVYPMLPLQ